jgi:hypothetical protein
LYPLLKPNAKLSSSDGPWLPAGANFCPSCRSAKRRKRQVDVQRPIVARKTKKLVGRRKMRGGENLRRFVRTLKPFETRRLCLLRKLSWTKASYMLP